MMNGSYYGFRLCVFLRLNVRNGMCKSCPNVRSYSSTIPCSRGQTWYTPEDVELKMSRRDLQLWCKKLRIRANSKTTQLRSDLLDFHRDVLSKSTILKYPFLPVQAATKLNLPLAPSHEKGLFVYRKIDGPQSNCLTDVHVGGSPGVRHYQKTMYDPDETHEGVVDIGACTNYRVRQVPSVSGILRATAPKSRLFAILHWSKKQKALLGEEVFRERMNEAKRNGTEFHRFIHQCLVDRQLNTKGPVRLQGFIESTKDVFGKLGDAIGSEKRVSHVHLGYKGRIDTLACYDGDPCVIEWKTSRKKKSCLEDCGDYPMQVVAYAGAINSDRSFGFKVKHGLIVIAYEDGSPADVHCLDLQLCRDVWEDWLFRVYEFYNQDSI